MVEVMFDTRSGEVLVDAFEHALSPDELGITILPLHEMLNAPDFPYTSEDYKKVDLSSWDRSDYVGFGRWVLQVLSYENEEMPNFTRLHLSRLYYLGLGPSKHHIESKAGFKNFTDYKQAVGASPETVRRRYDNWSTQDFVSYARQLEEAIQRCPKESDYNKCAGDGTGPSHHAIWRHFGGLKKLHEYLGYPDTRQWVTEDYIEWGVKVMKANDGKLITQQIIRTLCASRRGPSDFLIAKNFETITDFKRVVEAEYLEIMSGADLVTLDKPKHYIEMLEANQLPPQWKDTTDDMLIAFAARYRVIKECCKALKEDLCREMAELSSEQLIAAIREVNPFASAGSVETTAVMLDVFDDIWPVPDQFDRYLRVA